MCSGVGGVEYGNAYSLEITGVMHGYSSSISGVGGVEYGSVYSVRRVQTLTVYGFAFTLSSGGRTNGLASYVMGSETPNANEACAVKLCFDCLESALPVKFL
ncbi:hypothetical protein Tco_0172991 [Tanacetum coccineum]